MNTIRPPRELSTLTREEAEELVRVSIPNSQGLDFFTLNREGELEIWDKNDDGFTLSPSGELRPSAFMNIANSIQVFALVDYLRSIGIKFD